MPSTSVLVPSNLHEAYCKCLVTSKTSVLVPSNLEPSLLLFLGTFPKSKGLHRFPVTSSALALVPSNSHNPGYGLHHDPGSGGHRSGVPLQHGIWKYACVGRKR